jgi:hypothetical protein
MVSDYGLDDRAIGVRLPAGANDFSSSLCVQAGSGATQPPVQWVPGVLSLGVKRGRGVTLTTYPHLVPRSWLSRSYISSPPTVSMACRGNALLYLPLTTRAVRMWKSRKKKLSESTDVGGMIISKYLKVVRCECDNWINCLRIGQVITGLHVTARWCSDWF